MKQSPIGVVVTLALATMLTTLSLPSQAKKDALERATRYSSADGNFTFRLKGRFHADAASYDDDVTTMHDDFKIRRLRIGFAGRLWKNWTYSYNYEEKATDGFHLKGAGIGYRGFNRLRIKVGNIQQPFSLEELTSSNHIPLMERSLANTFAPSYTPGVQVRTWGDNWSLTGGLFGDTNADRQHSNRGSRSYAVRGTFNPINRKRTKIHLGMSAVHRDLDSSQTINFGARPESRVDGARILSTGTLRGVDNLTLVGLETAFIKGPWLLQGEYMRADLKRNTRPDPTFDGGYLLASWIITGERQRYSGKSGKFRQIRPRSKFGALEAAVRYSTLDLQDKAVTGGEANNLTLGLNWHINRHSRVMANYITSNVRPNGTGIDEDINIFQLRFQFYF